MPFVWHSRPDKGSLRRNPAKCSQFLCVQLKKGITQLVPLPSTSRPNLHSAQWYENMIIGVLYMHYDYGMLKCLLQISSRGGQSDIHVRHFALHQLNRLVEFFCSNEPRRYFLYKTSFSPEKCL